MEHSELVAEMSQVEHLSTQDRLHLARMYVHDFAVVTFFRIAYQYVIFFLILNVRFAGDEHTN